MKCASPTCENQADPGHAYCGKHGWICDPNGLEDDVDEEESADEK